MASFVQGENPAETYTKQSAIGGGSFGKVYKGINEKTGETVAIKVIDVENAEDEVDDIIQEISILSELKSPYVTQYYGSYLHGSDLWIIMEFCSGGSCADLMKPGVFGEEYIAIIIRELLMGLEYLHADNKLHRDIKAANVLLGSNGQVKLADFGVSGQLSATMTKKNTFVGTPFWMAPEVIKQSGHDQKADIWSLGITALELALGEPPYSDIHPMKVLFLIPRNPPPKLEGNFSAGFKDFVELCLKKEPRERPTAKDLLRHPWIKKARKTSYLTELIKRYEKWHMQRGRSASDSDDEYDEPQQREPVNEDLWDFGTIRPAGARGQGLRQMNDAAANARVGPGSPRKPVPSATGENATIREPETVRAAKIPPLEMPPSPTKQSSMFAPPLSPTASATPLPPSPEKVRTAQTPNRKVDPPSPSKRVITPRRASKMAHEFDDFLQESILEDMKGMQIDDPTTPKAPRTQQPGNGIPPVPKLAGPISLPPIPPFKGHRKSVSGDASHFEKPKEEQPPLPQPNRAQQQQSLPIPQPMMQQPSHLQQQTSPQQQPLPVFAPPTTHHSPGVNLRGGRSSLRINQPTPATPQASRRDPARHPGTPPGINPATNVPHHAFQTPPQNQIQTSQQQQQSPPFEITALDGVVVPALEAALHRRTYNLNALIRNANNPLHTSTDPHQHPSIHPGTQAPQYQTMHVDLATQQRKAQTHERIRKLVDKAIRVFAEIDELDAKEPVGMGGEVVGLLEGFLEEVLVRVEAEDEFAEEVR